MLRDDDGDGYDDVNYDSIVGHHHLMIRLPVNVMIRNLFWLFRKKNDFTESELDVNADAECRFGDDNDIPSGDSFWIIPRNKI